MIQIDDHIRDAVVAASDHYGSYAAFAERCGIHYTLPGKYASCRVTILSDEVYDKMFPVLAPYLPKDPAYWSRKKLVRYAREHEEACAT